MYNIRVIMLLKTKFHPIDTSPIFIIFCFVTEKEESTRNRVYFAGVFAKPNSPVLVSATHRLSSRSSLSSKKRKNRRCFKQTRTDRVAAQHGNKSDATGSCTRGDNPTMQQDSEEGVSLTLPLKGATSSQSNSENASSARKPRTANENGECRKDRS
jgi:hypothetical protein